MTDFLLDTDGSVRFSNGDFAIDESEQQDVEFILATRPGDWKEHPQTGANISQYLKSREAKATIAREVHLQLRADGFKISKISVNYPNIYVDARRK